ncbi:hypothetical protein HK101_000866 [Irineochytrium annulatum]|nr:hypothetical protein HK101_000866 [Irineochytrium annulatum]
MLAGDPNANPTVVAIDLLCSNPAVLMGTVRYLKDDGEMGCLGVDNGSSSGSGSGSGGLAPSDEDAEARRKLKRQRPSSTSPTSPTSTTGMEVSTIPAARRWSQRSPFLADAHREAIRFAPSFSSPQSALNNGSTGWIERMIVERYHRAPETFPFDFVHFDSFLETYDTQPEYLRSALTAFAVSFSYPHAPLELRLKYYDMARSHVAECLDSPSAESVQTFMALCLCSIGLGKTQAISTYMGMAARMATFLQLNIDPDLHPKGALMSWQEKETMRRIWWFCVTLDRGTTVLLGVGSELKSSIPVEYNVKNLWSNAVWKNPNRLITSPTSEDLLHPCNHIFTIMTHLFAIHEYVQIPTLTLHDVESRKSDFLVLVATLEAWHESLPQEIRLDLDSDPIQVLLTLSSLHLDTAKITVGLFALHQCAHCMLHQPRIHLAADPPVTELDLHLNRSVEIAEKAAVALSEAVPVVLEGIKGQNCDPLMGFCLAVASVTLLEVGLMRRKRHPDRWARYWAIAQRNEKHVEDFATFWLENRRWSTMVREAMEEAQQRVKKAEAHEALIAQQTTQQAQARATAQVNAASPPGAASSTTLSSASPDSVLLDFDDGGLFADALSAAGSAPTDSPLTMPASGGGGVFGMEAFQQLGQMLNMMNGTSLLV